MTFPDNFIWGAAAASYQIEGSTQGTDGCGPSVWDMCCRRDGFVQSGDTGFTACDHYNRYQEDVAIMKQIGLKAYRLSIMWPRIMPKGTGQVNQAGLDFYDRLVDELCNAGIAPWITLFHWDYPEELFNRGGWLNDDSPLWFEEYTKVIVDQLSDRVGNWFTLNEPACFIGLGHQTGRHAPGIQLADHQVTRAWHNAMLAHGRAVKTIRAHSKIAHCNVGAAPVFTTAVPASDKPEDIEAARQRVLKRYAAEPWDAAWNLEPLFTGAYHPKSLEAWGDAAPIIKEGDMELIGQELDFLGLNIYNSEIIKAGDDGQPEVIPHRNDAPHTAFNWPITPAALQWAATFLHQEYNKPIIITENGLSNNDWVGVDGKVHDGARIDFLNRHLLGLEKAMENGAEVAGYFQWSIMDNFEWAEGYHERFGLVHVDYQSQKRTIKDSGHWYGEVISSNGAKLHEAGSAILFDD